MSGYASDAYAKSCYLDVYDQDNNADDYVGRLYVDSIAQTAINKSGTWVTVYKLVNNGATPKTQLTVKMRRL